MKRKISALMAVILCWFVAAALGQVDDVCETFATDSAGCVAPCTGKPQIDNMITFDNGAGYYHIINVTFTCSAFGTNRCSQTTQVPTAQVNSWCYQQGGGGSGPDCFCDGTPPVCPPEECDLVRQSSNSHAPRGAMQREWNVEFLDLSFLRQPAKPGENRQAPQNNQ